MWFLFLFQLFARQSSPFPNSLPLNLHLSHAGGWFSQQTWSKTFWMDVMFAFCWKSPVILCSINKALNLFRFAQFTDSFLSPCSCIQDTLYENRKLYLSNRTCRTCWDLTDYDFSSSFHPTSMKEKQSHWEFWTTLDHWPDNLWHCSRETTTTSSLLG